VCSLCVHRSPIECSVSEYESESR